MPLYLPVTKGGNATVPDAAVIRPPQAFVELISTYFGTNTFSFAGASQQVTFIDSGWFSLAIQNVNGPSVNFSGCALERNNMYGLASACSGEFNGYVNFAGTSNPTFEEASSIPAKISFDLQSFYDNGSTGSYLCSGPGITLSTNPELELAASYQDGSGQIFLGTLDSPQPLGDIFNKFVALMTDYYWAVGQNMPSLVLVPSSSVVEITDSDSSHFPYSAGGAFTLDSDGTPWAQSSYIIALINSGWHGDYSSSVNGYTTF